MGGFGAGTFSRSYRGDFARWHIKAGVHKYQPVYADQFALYERAEGDAASTEDGTAGTATGQRADGAGSGNDAAGRQPGTR